MIPINIARIRRFLMGCFLALSAPLALAQNSPLQEGEEVQEPSKPLCNETANEAGNEPSEQSSPTPVAEDCVAGAPDEALGESANPEEMRASMRRFVPSEQISEDSSVAFPNDI